MQCRLMQQQDIESAYQIELENYEYPWSLPVFTETCENSEYNLVICSGDGEVVGFLLLMLVMDECQILNFAIRKDKHRKGYGKYLLQYAIKYMPKQIEKIWLEVRQSNIGAQQLYELLGFKKMGIRKNYYQHKGKNEDAMLYVLENLSYI